MKVCFIGLGSIGKRHLNNLTYICSNANINLTVDALRSRKKKTYESTECFISHTYYDFDDLDSDYDIIFITNPTYLHYETLMRVKSKASHFFIEKPLFCDISEDYIASISDLKDKTAYVACPLRYTQILSAAEEIVQKHDVFSVRAISSSYLPDWRQGIDYRKTYSAHRAEGGGVCIDLIHEWDYLTHLFGFPDTVKSYDKKLSRLDIDSEDVAVYIAEYKDMLLELHLDYFGRNTQRKLELFCDDATYTFDILEGILYKNSTIISRYRENPNDKYIKELESFLNICYEGKENPNTIENAYKVLRFIEDHRRT